MSQPVKLSDALVLDARQMSAVAERSIAGQIEFWASLGRAVEPLLSGDQSLALRRAGDEQPLSALIATVDTKPGHRRVSDYLAAQPFPHYEPAEGRPGLLVRIEQNGERTVGKFVRGEFCPARATPAKPSDRKRRPQP
jgi:ParD-like antitoxin of type II bacterial toxin-antitoxin system